MDSGPITAVEGGREEEEGCSSGRGRNQAVDPLQGVRQGRQEQQQQQQEGRQRRQQRQQQGGQGLRPQEGCRLQEDD